MRFCFGTFGAVLNWGSVLTQKELVGNLAGIIDPQSRYIDDGPTVHKLMKCNIEFVDASYDKDKKTKEDVINGFEKKVIPYLHMDKLEGIVLALCDIIYRDKAIDISHKIAFKKIFGSDKQTLLEQNEYE